MLRNYNLTIGLWRIQEYSIEAEKNSHDDILNVLKVSKARLISKFPPLNEIEGILLPNGSYTGLYGMIQKKEIEVNLFPTTYDYFENPPGNFTPPFQKCETQIITVYEKTPIKYSDVLSSSNIIAFNVWAMFILSYIIINTILIVSTKINLYKIDQYQNYNRINAKNVYVNLIKKITWSLFQASLSCTNYLPTKILSIKTLSLIYFVGLFIYLSIFKSLLSMYLVITDDIFKINSIQDLNDTRARKVKPIIKESGIFREYVRNSQTEDARFLNETIERFGADKCIIQYNYTSVIDIVSDAMDPSQNITSAFIFPHVLGKFVYFIAQKLSQNKWIIHLSQKIYNTNPLTLLIRFDKDVKKKNLFIKFFLYAFESGQWEFVFNRAINYYLVPVDKDGLEINDISFEQMISLCRVYFLILICIVILFLVKILQKSIQNLSSKHIFAI